MKIREKICKILINTISDGFVIFRDCEGVTDKIIKKIKPEIEIDKKKAISSAVIEVLRDMPTRAALSGYNIKTSDLEEWKNNKLKEWKK